MVLWKLIIILASLIVLFLLLSPPSIESLQTESFTRLSGAGSGSIATSGSLATSGSSFGDEYCTRGCGTGYYVRMPKCYDKNSKIIVSDSLCNATPKPEIATATCNTDPCSWLVDKVSDCSTTCGTGIKTTTYKCSSADPSDCEGLTLPAGAVLTNGVLVKSESCSNHSGCSWSLGSYGNCIPNTSGETCTSLATQSRSVTCISGNDSDCLAADSPAGIKPVISKACTITSGCSWVANPFPACVSFGESQTVSQRCKTTDSAMVSSCGGATPIPQESLSRVCAVPVKWSPDSRATYLLMGITYKISPLSTDLQTIRWEWNYMNVVQVEYYWVFYNPDITKFIQIDPTTNKVNTGGRTYSFLTTVSGNTMTIYVPTPYGSSLPFTLNFTDLGKSGALPS